MSERGTILDHFARNTRSSHIKGKSSVVHGRRSSRRGLKEPSSSDEVVEVSPPRISARRAPIPAVKRPHVVDCESGSDESVPTTENKKRISRTSARFMRRKLMVDSDDDVASKLPLPSSEPGDDKAQDSDEDSLLDEISGRISRASSSSGAGSPQSVSKSRVQRKTRLSNFEIGLERLKRKKLSKVDPDVVPSDQASEASEDDGSYPFEFAKPTGSLVDDEDSHNDDDSAFNEEEDFIVDDAPPDGSNPVVIPPEFSSTARQDLACDIKVVYQLFVHLTICPGNADRLFSDEYFATSLKLVRRKLSDLRNSITTSSWRGTLGQALQTYPIFNLTKVRTATKGCDGCNITSRHSTIAGRCSGKLYEKRTYQPIRSPKGETSVQKEFSLGRFCAQRAKLYHELYHWEYTLYHSISKEISSHVKRNETKFVRVAFAGGVKPPSDPQDANAYVDWMEQRGAIAQEWKRLKDLMERAVNIGTKR